MRTLDSVNIGGAASEVPDLKVFGDGDLWTCISKASSRAEGWMKSTKVMQIHAVGCLVQVTTFEKGLPAEALTFVPGVTLAKNADGHYHLVPINAVMG